MGNFGSDSLSKTLTIAPDESITAQDQAVVITDRSRNRGNIKLGQGATINNGLTAAQVKDLLATSLSSAAPIIENGSGSDIVSGPAINDLLDTHFEANKDATKDNVAAGSPVKVQNFVIAGVVLVAVIAVLVVLVKHK